MTAAISMAHPPLTLTAITAQESQDDAENQRDVALMVQIAQGDESAMRELIERHQLKVVGTITRMLSSENEAEDLAQQVFIRIWKSAGRYQPRAKFTTWMFTIVRNLVFNESRRRRHRDVQDELTPELRDPKAKSPDVEALDSEKMEAIEAAIAALPESQRLAVVLRRYEDIPYEEMAVILKQSVPGVKSLLFRARTTLRESLKRYLE